MRRLAAHVETAVRDAHDAALPKPGARLRGTRLTDAFR